MDTRKIRRPIPTWRIRAKLDALKWAHAHGVPFTPFLAVKALT